MGMTHEVANGLALPAEGNCNMSTGSVFIAGTDTGIGKTHVACALIHALREAGYATSGMKPVASGCVQMPDGWRNDDALALQAASEPMPAYEDINPVALAEAVAPHLAAELAGIEITLPPLRRGFDALQASHDWVVVEGVGGWMVPLSPSLMASALAQEWKLPVILVVGLRLGCINHAQLSARAIETDGCRLLGWIGNRIDPSMPMADENIEALRRLLPAPCLGIVPFGNAPADAAAELLAAVEVLAG
jgi:dethiobiotin synthetase